MHFYRNSKLCEQLQALRKKEAEETKALEDMVAKVEENLVTSTVSYIISMTQDMHCVISLLTGRLHVSCIAYYIIKLEKGNEC